MRLKRLISCLLSAALLAGLLVFPPASASGSGGFSDISDSTVADAAEMLRLPVSYTHLTLPTTSRV